MTVTRPYGYSKPALKIAVRTLSALSRTAASGKPTIAVVGSFEWERSASTSQGFASIPCNTKLLILLITTAP